MTGDEARDVFGEAIEGTLDAAQRDAFERALAADEGLREEFDAFRAMLSGVAALGHAEETTPAPDLLPLVQSRLRRRSRGRFYRDRFSEKSGRLGSTWPVLVALAAALLLAAGWLAMNSLVHIEAPTRGADAGDPPASAR